MNDFLDEEKDGLAVFVVGDKNNGEKLIQLCFSVPYAENRNADWFTRFYKDGKWHNRHYPDYVTKDDAKYLFENEFGNVDAKIKSLQYGGNARPFGVGFRHGVVRTPPYSDTVVVDDGGLNAPGNSFSVGAIYGTPPLGGFAGLTGPTSNLYLDFSTPFGVLFGDEFLLGIGGGGGRLFGNKGRWGFEFQAPTQAWRVELRIIDAHRNALV